MYSVDTAANAPTLARTEKRLSGSGLVTGIVIDSGPLIALFNGADKYHQAAVNFIRSVDQPLYTNIAVLTEVVFVLDFDVRAQLEFLS